MSPLPGRFKVRNPLLHAGLVAAIALPLVSISAAPPPDPGPRTADGKPDLSGLWDHPFVIDMSKDARNDACGAEVKGCTQKGPGGELPMTEWACVCTKIFVPARYDATVHDNPIGYACSLNDSVPTDIVQSPKEIVF